ncbi:MAG: DUF5011 domain-containing protein [Chitinophagaceae bacterium]|nr:DUF5011 domain-containing protein [Chitinophagaceae bacterium]
MKTIQFKYLTILLIAFFALASCTKNKVEPSKPTYLPTISLNGDELIILEEGTEYPELGAIAKEKGNPIDVTIEGDVDVTTPGVYPVYYSAVNADGYSVEASRTVVIYPTDAIDVESDPVLGDFTLATPARPAPVPTMSLSKISTKVYATTNIYGSNGSNALILVPAYLYTTDGIVYNVIDASLVGGNIASGGTATWNSVTKRLACVFQIASVGPGTNFSRTWKQN